MKQGNLSKMHVRQGEQVHYNLRFDGQEINMNERIGKPFSMQWTGAIFCMNCGTKTKTSFSQGYCYRCFQSVPECAECVIRPELCEAHLGKGRDIVWEQENHNQPHVVYLAATDTIKVGITRKTNIFTRWIDQGAKSTLIFAETPNRYQAGLIEVALKDFLTDKTNWRNMLMDKTSLFTDLIEEKWRVAEELPRDISDFVTEDEQVHHFNYPVLSYPTKVNSINLEKEIQFTRNLVGIRGQYLIFDDGNVINFRKYGGYNVIIED
ncbi:MAG TPA: DUF2797 domain-containing protein [Crocinitomicaceae bacterium]|nr:DUF2797 domain-containing protein [Crocinitomicaceae bacterium]